MRAIAMLSLVVLTGCASSGPMPARPASETVRISGPAGRTSVTLTSNTRANVKTLPFPLEQVWGVLPTVYDSLAIPIETVDPTKRVIGNTGFKLRKQLGRVALSRYIECGETQIGPNADTYEVVLTVVTQLQAGEAETTMIATTVEALARPLAFAQEYSQCTSKGLLESRLVDAVKARLQR